METLATHHSYVKPTDLLMGTSYLIPPPLCSWLTVSILDVFQRIALGSALPYTVELECLGIDTHIPGPCQPIFYHRKAQLLALRQQKLRGVSCTPELPGIRTWPGPECTLARLLLLSPVSLALLPVSARRVFFVRNSHLNSCPRLLLGT